MLIAIALQNGGAVRLEQVGRAEKVNAKRKVECKLDVRGKWISEDEQVLGILVFSCKVESSRTHHGETG